MIIRKNEMNWTTKSDLQKGSGTVQICDLLPIPPDNIRLINILVMDPGVSVGPHGHIGESEIYYILEGVLTLTDNKTTTELQAGDIYLYQPQAGRTHAIQNSGKTTVKFIAIIVKE